MIISPHLPPLPTTQAAQSPSPHNNAAMATAAVAAQKLAKPTETQTRRAASAVAQGDRSRENKDGTFVGHAFDNEAAAVNSRTNNPPPRGRGDKLDFSV